jgi:putative FmdB family regulatory protein
MPIYEFRCEECGRITVQRLPISSKQQVVKCDFCNEIKSKRIISTSTFMLKGGGWYADEYNKKEE